MPKLPFLLLLAMNLAAGFGAASFEYSDTCPNFCETLSATQAAAQTVAMGTVANPSALLTLTPDQLNNLETFGYALPYDWQCQSRISGSAWPCPNGIPTPCRYFNQVHSPDITFTDECVHHYCASSASSADTCCPYFRGWLGGAPSDLTINASPMEPPTAKYTGGDSQVNVSQQLASDLINNPAVCNAQVAWLTDYVWGHANWHLENHGLVYQTFKIQVVEVAEAGWVEIKDAVGNAVFVNGDGVQEFRPVGHEVSIPLFDDVNVSMPAPVSSRRHLEVSGKHSLAASMEHQAALVRERYAGACHPYHGCAPITSNQVKRSRQLFGEDPGRRHHFSTGGSFTLSSNRDPKSDPVHDPASDPVHEIPSSSSSAASDPFHEIPSSSSSAASDPFQDGFGRK